MTDDEAVEQYTILIAVGRSWVSRKRAKADAHDLAVRAAMDEGLLYLDWDDATEVPAWSWGRFKHYLLVHEYEPDEEGDE